MALLPIKESMNHNCKESGGMKKKRSILKELIKVVRYERSPHAFVIRVYLAIALFEGVIAVAIADYQYLFKVVEFVGLSFLILAFRGIERYNRRYAYLDGKRRGLITAMHIMQGDEKKGGKK